MNGSTTPSLDELFQEAKAAMRSRAKLPPVADDPLAVWRNPSNWRRTRGVALVHSDTMLLLGNFVEYVHRSVEGARKLVRETPGLPIASTEFVHGDWMTPVEAAVPAQAIHRTVSLTINLDLPQLGINAPQAKVTASLCAGKLTALELRERTLFQQQPAALSTLIYLPKATDVFLELGSELIAQIEAETA